MEQAFIALSVVLIAVHWALVRAASFYDRILFRLNCQQKLRRRGEWLYDNDCVVWCGCVKE